MHKAEFNFNLNPVTPLNKACLYQLYDLLVEREARLAKMISMNGPPEAIAADQKLVDEAKVELNLRMRSFGELMNVALDQYKQQFKGSRNEIWRQMATSYMRCVGEHKLLHDSEISTVVEDIMTW